MKVTAGKGLAIVAAVIPRVLFFLLLLPSPSTSTSAGRNLRRQARPIRFNEHHPTTSTEEEEENWKSLPKVAKSLVSQSGRTSAVGAERICMKKVVSEETLEYDEEERCHHVTKQNCYQVFKTVYKKAVVEECKEKFLKECTIEYEPRSEPREVEVCDERLTRDCDDRSGREVCSTEYQTVCRSDERVYEVEDDAPECHTVRETVCSGEDEKHSCAEVPRRVCTLGREKARRRPVGGSSPAAECQSVPVEVCGPELCPIVKGERVCRSVVRHVVQDVPREHCSVVPSRSCAPSTRIVPSLVSEEKCVDEPREVCAVARVNPRRVVRPVIKWWCSSPKEEGEDDDEAVATDSSSGEDEEGKENFQAAFQLPPTLEDAEETFEYYSHFLMLNGAGQAALVTFDADGDNCPLRDMPEPPQSGKFGMLLDGAQVLRVCGVDDGDDGDLACHDYDASSRSFAPGRGYAGGAGRVGAAVIEISPEVYWSTGGILAGAVTASTVLLREGGEPEVGPRLPLPLHSHCVVRVNATHFFFHGGSQEVDASRASKRDFLFDATSGTFSEVAGEAEDGGGDSGGFSGHVCGVVREDGLRVLAVGGGEEGNKVSSFDVSSESWTDLGPFPDGLDPRGIEKWQMEGTFMVIGLPSPSAGRRSLIYEFDTAETRFVRVDTTSVPLEVTADGDNVLLPVPPEFAQQCLDVAAAEQGGQQ